jgi:hypothetical protein
MRQLPIHPFQDIRCSVHGILGVLPCAWPSCQKGIREDQFEQDLLIRGQAREVFTRRKWQSPLGDHYYTWESSEMGNWIFLSNTFWNEARRHGLVSRTPIPTAYHYTSVDGLLGIISSESLWLSDYSYLNDSREMAHGAAVLEQSIDEILRQETDAASLQVLHSWKEQLTKFSNRVCIASFSEDSDSLPLWRGYGPVAIGCDVRALCLHVNQGTLQRVEYREEVQQKLASIYIHHASAAAARDATLGKFEGLRTAYLRAEQLLEIIAFFKNPGFASEREVRLAHVDNPELYKRLGFEKLPKSFRVSGNRLLPYVSSTQVLDSAKRDFPLKFTEVVLGPDTDDLLTRGVRELLDELDLQGVTVRRSAIPFRT